VKRDGVIHAELARHLAAFAVRTGEDTFFANVLCRAGVPFG
jgi:D-ribose pyranose/furanose isomerase RbsD